MALFPNDDPENRDRMRTFMRPDRVDMMIRQAIQLAWVMLPDERKNVTEVERVIRQMVDRAVKNYREDSELFEKL